MSIYQSLNCITKLYYLKGHTTFLVTREYVNYFTSHPSKELHQLQDELCNLHIRTFPYRTNLLKKKDKKENKSERKILSLCQINNCTK